MGFYLSVVLLSATQAAVPVATLFYTWQLARVFLVYAVVTKACADERVVPSLLKGMAIGLCFQACVVIWERVGGGAIQATGTFGHQNLLGMVSHFVIFPFFALLLAGERGWWPATAPLAGGVIAAMTASRATVGLVGLGLTVVFALSATRGWTAHKARVALFGAAAIAVLAPLALASLDRRFAADPLLDYDERAQFVSAAAMMLANRPMGIGANNFAVVNNTQGYAERVEIYWKSRSNLVHNIYWLTLAEMGYLGLVALLLLLLRPLTVAFRCGWRNRGDPRGDLMIGFATSLLIIYIHSYFEWVFFTTHVQYIFAMTAGMIAGLAQEMGYWRRAKVHSIGLSTASALGPIRK
jgi:O-antigen ligase